MRRFAALLTVFSLLALVLGCGSPQPKPPVGKTNPHEHEEEHHHPGPHKGLVAVIGDDKNHVEWTHNDKSGKVQLFILDDKKEKEVPIAMENLVIVSGDKEYTLDAVNATDGKTAVFESSDKELLGVIESLSDKVTAEVKEIDIDGTKHKNVKLVEDHDHD